MFIRRRRLNNHISSFEQCIYIQKLLAAFIAHPAVAAKAHSIINRLYTLAQLITTPRATRRSNLYCRFVRVPSLFAANGFYQK